MKKFDFGKKNVTTIDPAALVAMAHEDLGKNFVPSEVMTVCPQFKKVDGQIFNNTFVGRNPQKGSIIEAAYAVYSNDGVKMHSEKTLSGGATRRLLGELGVHIAKSTLWYRFMGTNRVNRHVTHYTFGDYTVIRFDRE